MHDKNPPPPYGHRERGTVMGEKLTSKYELGNCLRGYFSGRFTDDDAAWAALSDQFNRRFPSREGRQVEMRKVIRLGTTAGGNETEQDRKLRESLERMEAEDRTPGLAALSEKDR